MAEDKRYDYQDTIIIDKGAKDIQTDQITYDEIGVQVVKEKGGIRFIQLAHPDIQVKIPGEHMKGMTRLFLEAYSKMILENSPPVIATFGNPVHIFGKEHDEKQVPAPKLIGCRVKATPIDGGKLIEGVIIDKYDELQTANPPRGYERFTMYTIMDNSGKTYSVRPRDVSYIKKEGAGELAK